MRLENTATSQPETPVNPGPNNGEAEKRISNFTTKKDWRDILTIMSGRPAAPAAAAQTSEFSENSEVSLQQPRRRAPPQKRRGGRSLKASGEVRKGDNPDKVSIIQA